MDRSTRRSLPIALAAVLFMLMSGLPAAASPVRFAVVIGNSDYNGDGRLDPVAPAGPSDSAPIYAPDLPGAHRDAQAVRAALARLGFEVFYKENADAADLKAAMAAFNATAATAGPGARLIFYFSGHSVQIEEQQYLIPVRTLVPTKPGLGGNDRFSYMDLDRLTRGLVSILGLKPPDVSDDLTLVLLDACRTNPWPGLADRGWRADAATDPELRSDLGFLTAVGDGFPGRPDSTVLMLAAAPGHPAADLGDSVSPFTTAVLAQLGQPISVRALTQAVGRSVLRATGGRQRPYAYQRAFDDRCLSVCTPGRGDWLPAPSSGLSLASRRAVAESYAAADAALRQARLAAGIAAGVRTDAAQPWVGAAEQIPGRVAPSVGYLADEDEEAFRQYFRGQIRDGRPDGLGVYTGECVTVFRSRCPLSEVRAFTGSFVAGAPGGPGVFLDARTGEQSIGRFAGPDMIEGRGFAPQLELGVTFMPNGDMSAGRMRDGRVAAGVVWRNYGGVADEGPAPEPGRPAAAVRTPGAPDSMP
jgi:hypothetical protein